MNGILLQVYPMARSAIDHEDKEVVRFTMGNAIFRNRSMGQVPKVGSNKQNGKLVVLFIKMEV